MPSAIPGPSFRLPLRKAFSNFRTFAASQSAAASRVPPESTSYIRLPTPLQSDEAQPPIVRGHLPVPREIFPRSEGDRKVQPAYFRKTAPRSPKSREDTSEARKWKAMMADKRRSNLQDGLNALWARRRRSDKMRNARVHGKFLQHNELGAAPEKESDRLTRPTILAAITDTTVYPDPERFSRADRSRSQVLAHDTIKREARKDALMELYISASDFIVHETELKTTIDSIFAEEYFKKQKDVLNRHGAIENAWGTFGKPPSVANMIESTTGSSTRVMDFDETEHDKSVKRAKRIADDLTGGKMA